MSASERRASILSAAALVFGAHGYVGTTTDQIARAAGISQPYVVRMFGTKERLFMEVLEVARAALVEGFRKAIADHAADPSRTVVDRLGEAYLELTVRGTVHQVLMQAFVLGAEPEIGRKAREGVLGIWRLLRDEAGLDLEAATDFFARGMLINMLLGTGMPMLAGSDPAAHELLVGACGPDIDAMLRSSREALAR